MAEVPQPLFRKEIPMRKVLTGSFLAVAVGLAVRAAQDHPPLPKPVKEHDWLRQLEGSWEGEFHMLVDPANPQKTLETPRKSKMTETTRMVGGFWAVPVIKSEMFGQPFEALGQIGYDAAKGKYVGTWIDSMMPFLWSYEGSVDASGRILTLEATGPSCEDPNRMAKYRDVHEIVDKNTRRMSSSFEKDGKWIPIMKAELKRTK
jgi:hypothetical protein